MPRAMTTTTTTATATATATFQLLFKWQFLQSYSGLGQIRGSKFLNQTFTGWKHALPLPNQSTEELKTTVYIVTLSSSEVVSCVRSITSLLSDW